MKSSERYKQDRTELPDPERGNWLSSIIVKMFERMVDLRQIMHRVRKKIIGDDQYWST